MALPVLLTVDQFVLACLEKGSSVVVISNLRFLSQIPGLRQANNDEQNHQETVTRFSPTKPDGMVTSW